jgi:hypothetical protein
MKRIAGMLGALALAALVPMIGVAGDYHSGTTLKCSDCHVMHYSQSHSYDTTGAAASEPLGGSGPYDQLLRDGVNNLCMSCHNGQSNAPDVVGAHGNGYVRMAGALNELGDEGEETGHTLGSTADAPGGTWDNASGLGCTDCHTPHGNSYYRNLRDDVGDYSAGGVTLTYATGTNDTTNADVFQTANTPMATHYAFSNVNFNEPVTTASEYATFCKGCHTNFHGAKGGGELGGATGVLWKRHPTNDADIGAVGDATHSDLATFTGKTNKVKVMSKSGVWSPPAADNTPSCMTCHKSHGNQNPFGLIYMEGGGTVDEEGDGGTLRDLCKQCHVQ